MPESNITVFAASEGKEKKDKIRQQFAQTHQSDINPNTISEEANTYPEDFPFYDEIDGTEFLSTEELSHETLNVFHRMTDYWKSRGMAEGIFNPDTDIEFRFLVYGPTTGFDQDTYQDTFRMAAGTNQHKEIQTFIDQEKIKEPQHLLEFLTMLFHEMRHRVKATNLLVDYEKMAPEQSYTLNIGHLSKPTFVYHLSGGSLEEVFTVGDTAEHFRDFLESYFPSSLPLYDEDEIFGQEKIKQKIPDSLPGIGTLVFSPNQTEKSKKIVTSYGIYLAMYWRFINRIPHFRELITDARNGEKHSLSQLLQAIKNEFGTTFFKNLLRYEGPLNQDRFAEGEALLKLMEIEETTE